MVSQTRLKNEETLNKIVWVVNLLATFLTAKKIEKHYAGPALLLMAREVAGGPLRDDIEKILKHRLLIDVEDPVRQ